MFGGVGIPSVIVPANLTKSGLACQLSPGSLLPSPSINAGKNEEYFTVLALSKVLICRAFRNVLGGPFYRYEQGLR